MNKSNNYISNSENRFNNSASGIKFSYKTKNKLTRNEFYRNNNLNIDEDEDNDIRPELNRKHKNDFEFKSISKQTKKPYKYKNIKKEFDIEEIDEKDEQIKLDNSSDKNNNNESPVSILQKSDYTNKSIINSKIFNNEDDNKMRINDKNDLKDIINEINFDNSKELKSDKDILENNFKYPKKKEKKSKKNINKKSKKIKWKEEEYQKIKSDIKNYIPLKGWEIKDQLLSPSQIDIIKQIPELYQKYIFFQSMIEKQYEIRKDILIKNILKNFKFIYKHKIYLDDFIINLFQNIDFSKIKFNSYKNSACYDLFICFIYIYIDGFNQFIEKNSLNKKIKLNIPMNELAYIYSTQIFFCTISRIIKNYYNKFLEFRFCTIPIYIKNNEIYRYKINMRKIIWKQFEIPFLYFKNKKGLFNKDNTGENYIDKFKIKKFSEKIHNNAYLIINNISNNIKLKNKNLNEFNINDNNITLTKNNISASSSLYNQLNNDILLKLKINLFKYNNRKLNIEKINIINNVYYQKYEFRNQIKKNLFKQNIFYMNSYDIIEDFLNNTN